LLSLATSLGFISKIKMHLCRHVKVVCPDSNGDGMPPCMLALLAAIDEFRSV
jgi:hypothetical protein